MIEIKLRIEGLTAAIGRLDRMDRNLSAVWRRTTPGIMQSMLEHAQELSPVDTGAYQGSHRVAITATDATLYVDPAARNPRTGTPVTEYAPILEHRIGIYNVVINGRYADDLAEQTSERIML